MTIAIDHKIQRSGAASAAAKASTTLIIWKTWMAFIRSAPGKVVLLNSVCTANVPAGTASRKRCRDEIADNDQYCEARVGCQK